MFPVAAIAQRELQQTFCQNLVLFAILMHNKISSLWNARFLRVVFFVLIFGMVSCGALEKRPPFMADISGIDVPDVEIKRYEEVLFRINPNKLYEEIQPYISTFGFFLGDAIHTQVGRQQLFDYISDPLIREIYMDTKEVWYSLDELEENLTEAFRFYRYHFPQNPLPRLYSYISGLDHQFPIKYYDGVMVIGLDLYLGAGYEKYMQAGIQQFQQFRMQPAFLESDIMRMMAENHLQQTEIVPQNLLDFMIYEGKVLYFLDSTLPLTHDSLKIGFTGTQLHWMQQNLDRVWTFFIENELLFSNDRGVIRNFVGEAPFTTAFGNNSPPRTAAYIGWQIVRAFMQHNPDVTLSELLHIQDSQKILTRSRFRP